jgi:hypothetical protein
MFELVAQRVAGRRGDNRRGPIEAVERRLLPGRPVRRSFRTMRWRYDYRYRHLNRGMCGCPWNLDKHLGCCSHRDVADAQPIGVIVDLLSIFNANPMKSPSKLLKPITA